MKPSVQTTRLRRWSLCCVVHECVLLRCFQVSNTLKTYLRAVLQIRDLHAEKYEFLGRNLQDDADLHSPMMRQICTPQRNAEQFEKRLKNRSSYLHFKNILHITIRILIR
ncbi:hypothetical protein evm_002856 [Chilo suppressalis]|nr:hypothetical protein evm_002856 [Chilo suppressalis]